MSLAAASWTVTFYPATGGETNQSKNQDIINSVGVVADRAWLRKLMPWVTAFARRRAALPTPPSNSLPGLTTFRLDKEQGADEEK